MQRRPIVAGNWKMHKAASEGARLAKQIKVLVADVTGVDVVVCPPFTALHAVSEAVRGSGVMVGGQDLFWEEEGAYTGEISASMLKDAGCQYVIVGHSERRTILGESDDVVNRKVLAAQRAGLIPILCVGESLAQRRAGATNAVVVSQLEAALAGVQVDDPSRLVIAYEPIWAIGTGENATAEQAQEVASVIRRTLTGLFGPEGSAIRIQYGGSVKPANIAQFMACPDIDGALVGGASLDASSFAQIVMY